jgi:hypothetical protein
MGALNFISKFILAWALSGASRFDCCADRAKRAPHWGANETTITLPYRRNRLEEIS